MEEGKLKRKGANNKLKTILFFGAMIVIGGLVGFYSGFLIDKFRGLDGGKEESFFISILRMYGFFLIFFIGFIVQIIIHEAGHLIFGLITGYKFISFRIDSFVLIREDGKFKLKRYNIPGTGGQCLMMPPEYKDGEFPFVLYNLGGGLLNLMVGLVSIVLAIYLKAIVYPYNIVLLLFGLAGLIAAITNLIPMKIAGISNDGHNIMSMKKDEKAKKGFHTQLWINGLLSQGTRLKDMDIEDFKPEEGTDITSPLNTYMALLHHQWHLDNLDFVKAREVLESMVPYLNDIIPLYKYELNIERMFLELIGENNKDFIDELYDKNLKKHIKAAKFMLSKKRFLMAYEGFYKKNKEAALKYYDEILKMAEIYPVKGEAEMELMLANYMRERLEEDM